MCTLVRPTNITFKVAYGPFRYKGTSPVAAFVPLLYIYNVIYFIYVYIYKQLFYKIVIVGPVVRKHVSYKTSWLCKCPCSSYRGQPIQIRLHLVFVRSHGCCCARAGRE